MTKFALLLAFVFFAVLTSVSALPSVDITSVTMSPTSVNAGSSFVVTVAFSNPGFLTSDTASDDATSGFNFSQPSFTSGSNSFASPTIADYTAPVLLGDSATHTFTVSVPSGTPAATHTTTLEAI